MINSIKRLFIPILLLLAFGFILFLVNQISGIYLLVSDLNPVAGKITLVIMIVLAGVLLVSPFLIFWKLPKAIKPPEDEQQLPQYHKKLLTRLKENRVLHSAQCVPSSVDDLPGSIEVLNKKTDEIIGQTAYVVFLTTSISQNGKLDSLTVFFTQIRMVWNVAHIYYQRPTIRDLIYLYSNVGASSFLASEIEDIDFTRQIEPIANALFKNVSGRSVPILGNATQVVLDSLMEGSTNAFLTLRVGIIAKKLCGELGVRDNKKMRNDAVKEAAVQLRSITLNASGKIISSLMKATRNAGWESMKSSWEGIKRTGARVNPFKKKQELPTEE